LGITWYIGNFSPFDARNKNQSHLNRKLNDGMKDKNLKSGKETPKAAQRPTNIKKNKEIFS
jgi:hypothetical protein